MKNSILIVVSWVITVTIILGCAKKKSSQDTEFLSSEVAKQTTTSPTTQDIFDEFYKEENSKSQPQQEVSKTKTKEKEVAKKTSSLSESPSFSESGKYVVQIAAVPSYSLAEKISKKLKEKGYPIYIAEVINPTPSLSGTYYRVRIGGFKGFSEAKEFGEKYLAPEGYEYWVDKRSNDNRGVEIQSTPPSGAYYNPAESQSKADYLYYTPSAYTPPSSESATTTTTNTTTNQNSSISGDKVSSSGGEKKDSSQSSPTPPQSQTQQPSSGQTEWNDEW